MNPKTNRGFATVAGDPARRGGAIAEYSRWRKVVFWCAVGVTLCALVMAFTVPDYPLAINFVRGGAILLWLAVFWLGTNIHILGEFNHRGRSKTKRPDF